MQKQFSEINVGDVFIVNNESFKKLTEVKVSCCKSINAEALTNSNNRVYFPNNTVVDVNG